MSRPMLQLPEWCNQDQSFKIDFLNKECKSNNGLIELKGTQQGKKVFSDSTFFKNKRENDRASAYITAVLTSETSINISTDCFEKLKTKYRTFKKNKKDYLLIRKQYKFEKQTSDIIKQFKEQN